MLQKTLIAALALIISACATQVPRSDASSTRRQTAEQRAVADSELRGQLDSPIVKEEVQHLSTLPQPERWEKAKELLANKHILASCAFDKDHPVPEDPTRGGYAIVPC
jgi:hypothetical protein